MDKDWNFLPKSTDSFDNSNTKSIETFFYKNKFGLLVKSSNFNLDLLRPVEPKNLDLIANSKNLELFYIKDIDTVFSIDLKYQTTDTQVINCYTFSTVTLGNCNDAVLSIRNTKDKYKRLNGALLMIDGENQEIRLNFFKGLKNLLIDEIHIYSSISRNSFDWITPLEEIKSGFIYELTFNNQKVGDLVQTELQRLPQRDSFLLYKLGLNFKNNINIYKRLSFFYQADLLLLKDKDYRVLNHFQNNNIKLDTGINLKFDHSIISLFGTIYKNNLIGFEDISFNQRSEHHFDKSYGSLNLRYTYFF